MPPMGFSCQRIYGGSGRPMLSLRPGASARHLIRHSADRDTPNDTFSSRRRLCGRLDDRSPYGVHGANSGAPRACAPSVSFADSSPGGGAKGDTSSVIRRTVTRRMTPSPQGEGFVWPLREQSLWRRPELAATPSVTAACRRNSSLREGADRFPSFSPVLLIDGESGLCYIVSIILPKGV